ncbi:DNA-3-methyladenine glycosylase I [uncultured Porticoccus sp.]|uniref:DNA-3-methyladenine glycosylase I n=1 Tax=uncultured Porticoccus sp. TaxID=1256050 RepID=UPI00261B64DF|nr:DNA-3-methyladenine glycosylase I [uncultured Porticoccus sp.]
MDFSRKRIPDDNPVFRCPWAGNDPLYQSYHDQEWGVPCRDDRKLFEFLVLESAQAGLAWITILRKREHYRRAFTEFRPEQVARFNRQEMAHLLQNTGIVRNRLKIESAVSNARLFLDIQAQFGSFADYLWGFVDNRSIQNHWQDSDAVPATTPLSDTISKDMKKRGFRFFGSTICYAYLQATGLVNDHLVDCFRHRQCHDL